jgi:hypothetical protein
MDLLGFFKETIGFLEKENTLTRLNSLSHTGSPRIRCGLAFRGQRVAGPPLAATGDPAGSRAAWRGVDRHVAATGAA